MADLDLVFAPDSRGPLELVFGDSGDAATPEYTAHAAFRITGLGRTHVRAGVWANAAFRISRWPGATRGAYDYNVTRNLLAARPVAWQQAAPVAAAVRSDAQPSQPLATSRQSHFQRGLPVGAGTVARWQRSQPLQRGAVQHWQIGLPLAAAALAQFQRTIQLAAGHAQHFQRGTPTAAGILAAFQRTIQLSQGRRAAWQWGLPRAALAVQRMAAGVHIIRGGPAYWQAAMRPPPGRTIVIVPPQRPCYEPENPIHLVFDADDRAPLDLLFRCDRHDGPGPEPGGTIVVPPVRVRYVINETYLTRVADGARLPVVSMTVELDYKSWAWGLNAIVPAAAQGMLAPGRRDAPREVSAWINGTEIRFIIEEMDHDRVFGERNVRVSGRGRHAELDVMQRSYSNTAPRTSLQLMQDVLTLNNVPVGYDLDYQQTPWVVPGGVFAHQGTYISALKRIAEAGGGYLRPHFNRPEFSVLPLWPRAPWDAQVADIVIPAGSVTRESMRWVDKADYNQVWVCGQEQGHRGDVRRTGTSGDVPTQMVIDELITSPDAARQRGLSILADTGLQREIGLSLPVLPETGIIVPGKYIDYEDGSTHYTGLVRSVSVRVDEGFVEQTISIQSHHE